MKNPIIGITLDYEINGGYSKFPWYAIRENYLTCLHKFGAIPFPLFHENSVNHYFLNSLDGLVITGGDFDINPSLYSDTAAGSRNIKNKRTNFEIEIFNKFLEKPKPILGICGGEQLINVASGGDLIQDIKTAIKTNIQHEQPNPRDEVSHDVSIIQGSRLFNIIQNDRIKVNSAHHQSVKKTGENFVASAFASDNVIEAIEHTMHSWCFGVQWHPEFLITDADIAIVKDFINHA